MSIYSTRYFVCFIDLCFCPKSKTSFFNTTLFPLSSCFQGNHQHLTRSPPHPSFSLPFLRVYSCLVALDSLKASREERGVGDVWDAVIFTNAAAATLFTKILGHSPLSTVRKRWRQKTLFFLCSMAKLHALGSPFSPALVRGYNVFLCGECFSDPNKEQFSGCALDMVLTVVRSFNDIEHTERACIEG